MAGTKLGVPMTTLAGSRVRDVKAPNPPRHDDARAGVNRSSMAIVSATHAATAARYWRAWHIANLGR